MAGLRMYDRRDRSHPLGLMAEVCPLWTVGLLAELWRVSEREAWAMVQDYWRKNLLNKASLACKLIDPPAAYTYRHEPGMEIHPELPKELAATFGARYRRAKTYEVEVFMPSRKALQIFGLMHATPTILHASHDLLLAAIAIQNRDRGEWEYEPVPPGTTAADNFRQVQPDACLRNGSPLPFVFLECCAAYRESRLKSLLLFSNGANIPIELH